MVRFIIFFSKPKDKDQEAFERYLYDIHIPIAQKMPGVKRYTTSRCITVVRGGETHHYINELDWKDMDALKLAFASPAGQATAQDVANLQKLAEVQSAIYELDELWESIKHRMDLIFPILKVKLHETYKFNQGFYFHIPISITSAGLTQVALAWTSSLSHNIIQAKHDRYQGIIFGSTIWDDQAFCYTPAIMPIREKIRQVKHLQNKYFICVLENPKDIMNIAATLRNVSAFGVEKLYVIGNNGIVSDFETSRTNKRLTNLSVGANKWAFVKGFKTTADCITHLRENRYTIAVTSSHIKGKENANLYEGTYTQKRLAVWFGNEAKGISDEAAAEADMCIQIPMGGIVESLNLGTSTGIILSYIGYHRLQFVYTHHKVRFKPKGIATKKMRSWQDFIEPNRE